MSPKQNADKTVVAVGGFNSLHKGHTKLIETAVAKARRQGLRSLVVTFDEGLEIHKRNSSFMSPRKRKEIILALGADEVIIQPFDREFMQITPQEFVKDYLAERLNCKAVAVGENFRFGKDASGNAETLADLCREENIECIVLPLEKNENGEIISSSLLRKFAEKGETEKILMYTGRPLFICGNVLHGRKEGRTLGFPTVNIESEYLLPQNGVYASFTLLHGRKYPSVTNIGTAPTYGVETEITETCIFGVNEDLYGRNLEIGLLEKIRDIKKFASADELKTQLKQDKEKSIKIYEKYKNEIN